MNELTLAQAMGKRIMELANTNNYSLKILCELSDVPLSSVKNLIYNKTTMPNTAIALKICNYLEMSLTDFFNDNAFNNLKKEN